jgi:hypothetical protein
MTEELSQNFHVRMRDEARLRAHNEYDTRRRSLLSRMTGFALSSLVAVELRLPRPEMAPTVLLCCCGPRSGALRATGWFRIDVDGGIELLRMRNHHYSWLA